MLFSYTQIQYFSLLDKNSMIVPKMSRNINTSYTQNIIPAKKDKGVTVTLLVWGKGQKLYNRPELYR